MNRYLCAFILCVALVVPACAPSEDPPARQYTATLVRPDGGEQESWSLLSRTAPRFVVCGHGAGELSWRPPTRRGSVYRSIPVGWWVKIEEEHSAERE